MIKALLFDFDGLILDTETPEVTSWRNTFAEHGHAFPDEVWQAMIGQSGPHLAAMPATVLQELVGQPLDRDEILRVNKEQRLKLIEAEELMPGVLDLINAATDAGITCAVVSSSRITWVQGHLERLGIHSHFETLVCRDDVLPSKPAPDLYLFALSRLGITAAEALALEDSPKGIAAAKAAGITCWAVPNKLTAMLDLSEADRLFHSMEEVFLSEIQSA